MSIWKIFTEKHICVFLLTLSCSFGFAEITSCYAEIIPAERRINWAPGVPNGIPARTNICQTLNPGDSPNQINNAISNCSSGSGGVVYLNAGIYSISSAIAMKRNVTLRGAGPTSTIISSTAGWHIIQFGDWPSSSADTDVLGSPSKGDRTITVNSVGSPDLDVGDFIVIDQIDDNVEIFDYGQEDSDNSRDGNTRHLAQITVIQNISGTGPYVLTIDPPLYHDYSSEQDPEVWELSQTGSMITYAGVEDLAVTRDGYKGGGYSNFKFVAAAYCWLKNVRSNYTDWWHVDLDRSFRCEIRDSHFNDGYNHGTGGMSYGVVAGNLSCNHLIENNIFFHLRHSMVLKMGAAGNVFGYNYSLASYQGDTWLAGDIQGHGAHNFMNLFEGNINNKVYLDNTHGSASYNTFFRNWVIRDTSATDQSITNSFRAVDVERLNSYHNFVANVIGQAGQSWTSFETGSTRSSSGRYVWSFGFNSDGDSNIDDPQVKATALRHGNYDYATQSTQWENTISDKNLPDSLYLTSKPSFFGNLPWPMIGPDLDPLVGKLPAKERFNAPAPPTNFRNVAIWPFLLGSLEKFEAFE